MTSKRKKDDAPARSAEPDFDLPFSLYLSFGEIAGISLKPCGPDGQPLPGAPTFPTSGPCRVLCDRKTFAPACAENHAQIIATVAELRRPYIFTCHMRLAAWAVPILSEGRPLPAAIICGGVLLREADSALIAHVTRVAAEHGVASADLVGSLNSVPVLSRERIRAIADFLFQMSAAFTAVIPPTSPPDAAVTMVEAGEQPSLIFPPARTKETRKAKRKRLDTTERQNAEADIVRLLRERKPDAALEMLSGLLKEIRGRGKAGGTAPNFHAAETFTRLFRMLVEGKRIPRDLSDRQSLLVAEMLSLKTPKEVPGAAERSCAKFISIAEEITGERRPRQVKVIQRFLERNLAKKLTLGSVSKKFGLKERVLDALMRKYFEMGFTNYVALLRISEAKQLLLSSDLSVKEVGRRTGFRDQSYFTKVFKSLAGSTPTEFRNKRGKQTRAERKQEYTR